MIWPKEDNRSDSKLVPGIGLKSCTRQTVHNESVTRWTANFSSATRDPKDQVLKVNYRLLRILYPAKLLLKSERNTETF